MSKKDKTRAKSISCGTLTYRNVNNGLEVLLIKQFNHSDNWGVPKGHIHDGETLEQCAIRETREETGIDVVLGQRLPNTLARYKKEDKTVVVFLARQVCKKSPTSNDPDSEVAAAQWFPIAQLPQIHAYQQTMVKHGIALIIQESMINVANHDSTRK